MDVSAKTESWQRAIVMALVPIAALAAWPRGSDVFSLPKATLIVLGAVALVALGAIRSAHERRLLVPWSLPTAAVAIFVATLVVTTVTSSLPMLSLIGEFDRYTGLAGYLSYAVIALVVMRTFTRTDVVRLVEVAAVTLAVVAAYAVIQLADLDPYNWKTAGFGPTFATLGNANFLAGYVAISAPLAAWVALQRERPTAQRAGAGVLVLVAVLVAWLSQSLQGPVAALAGLGFAAVVVAADRRDQVRAFLARFPRPVPALAGIVVFGVGALAAVPIARSVLRDGLVERRYFWSTALSMFGEHPVVGNGLDTYGQSFLRLRPATHARQFFFTQSESAHSVPLNMLANGGLVLSVGYLLLLVVTAVALVVGLRRQRGDDRILLGCVGGAWLAYQVQSAVSMDVPPLALLHFVLAGAVVVLALDPPLRDVKLPGSPTRVVGRGRGARVSTPTSTQVAEVTVVVVAVILAWFVTRPFRADLAATSSFKARTAEGALARIDKATDLAPWQGRYWIYQAQLYERLQQPADAIRAAREAARREPGSSQYALLVARLQSSYFSSERAKDDYDEALARDPNNPSVWNEIATWAVDHEPRLALNLATRLVALDRTQGHLLLLARATEASGDPGDDLLREAIALDPSSSDVQRLFTGLRESDPQRAVELWTEVVEADPGNLDRWLTLAQFQITAGDFAGADLSIDEAEAIDPESYDVVVARINLEEARG